MFTDLASDSAEHREATPCFRNGERVFGAPITGTWLEAQQARVRAIDPNGYVFSFDIFHDKSEKFGRSFYPVYIVSNHLSLDEKRNPINWRLLALWPILHFDQSPPLGETQKRRQRANYITALLDTLLRTEELTDAMQNGMDIGDARVWPILQLSILDHPEKCQDAKCNQLRCETAARALSRFPQIDGGSALLGAPGTGALADVGGVGLAGFGAADAVCLADFGTVGATGFGAADGVGLGLGSLELLAPPEVCAAGCAPPRRTITGAVPLRFGAASASSPAFRFAGTGALAAVGGVGLAGFGAADDVCLADFGTVGATGFGAADGVGLADFGTVGATGFGAADGVGLGLGSLELLAPPEVCAAGRLCKCSDRKNDTRGGGRTQQQGALQRLLPSDELPSLSPDSEIHDRGLLVDADFARAAGVTHDPSEPLSVVISSLGPAQPPTLRDPPGMQLGSAYGQSRAGAAALADASTSLSLSAIPAPALSCSTPASATPSPPGFAASPSAAEQPIAESAGFPVILRPASEPSLGGPSGTQLQHTTPGQEVFSLAARFPTLVVNYVGARERREEFCAAILEAKEMARGHGSAPAWRSDLVPTAGADASEEEKKRAVKDKNAFNSKVSAFKLLLDAIVLDSGALKPGGVDYPSITRCIRLLSGTTGAKKWGEEVRKSYENGADGYGEKSAARAAYEGVRGGSEEERLAAARSFRDAVLDALREEPSLSSFADAGGAPGAASSSLTPLKRGRDESVLARFLAVDPGASERSATGVADFTFADGLCSSIRATSFMPRGTHVQKKKRVATEISALLDAVKPVCVFLEECYPPVGGYKYKLMELNHALRFAVVEACEERDVPCYMVNASTWLSHIGVSYPSGAKDEAKKKLVLVGAEPKGGGERGGLLSALGLRHDSIPFDMKRHDAADAVAIGLAGLAGKRDGYKKEKHVVTIKPRLPEGSSEPPRLGSPSQLEFVELSQL
ncbi:hypothetical protein EMIHUDRAFT_108988 [Emiliania huxleyi CCMP1516]|uniref:Uncharacterized protein n=2 Tax=Emiliania huxleyi TaxID=2903 RepID=A0A0D3KU07_EMIH1|nr:hypothetical protein EMIHUDRAFT_108988 [Emiliania huxleyi CCMP1516]EOD39242.1 hypothetical protein EMIHUDRAFT_108988 [Emiliania huxleyi CCMP1516]|eukprot:XP_005791671.1 hypothetical protein EMIHUDRAFT_108988 [Emiliania huxleyi CCMP1516]